MKDNKQTRNVIMVSYFPFILCQQILKDGNKKKITINCFVLHRQIFTIPEAIVYDGDRNNISGARYL